MSLLNRGQETVLLQPNRTGHQQHLLTAPLAKIANAEVVQLPAKATGAVITHRVTINPVPIQGLRTTQTEQAQASQPCIAYQLQEITAVRELHNQARNRPIRSHQQVLVHRPAAMEVLHREALLQEVHQLLQEAIVREVHLLLQEATVREVPQALVHREAILQAALQVAPAHRGVVTRRAVQAAQAEATVEEAAVVEAVATVAVEVHQAVHHRVEDVN